MERYNSHDCRRSAADFRTSRPHVMAAYQASLDRFADLYAALAQ